MHAREFDLLLNQTQARSGSCSTQLIRLVLARRVASPLAGIMYT